MPYKKKAMSKKTVSRSGRRRLQVGALGAAGNAAVATGLYAGAKISNWAYKKWRSHRAKVGARKRALNRLNKPINKAQSGESYVPSHSVVMGKRVPLVDAFRNRLYNTLYPPRIFQYNSTQRLDVESGKQNILSWSFTTSDILDDPSTKLRDLLSNLAANISMTETAGGNGVEWNRVYLNFSSMLSTFYNSSTSTCEFDVYVYKTKTSAAEVIGASDGRNLNPNGTWARAETAGDLLNNGQTFSTVTDSINTVGYKPTQAPYKYIMDRYWTLVDKESVVLMPGQSHKHYVRDQHPHSLRHEDFNSYKNLRGVTYYVMVVAKGQVATTNTAANTTITTSPAQLSIAIIAKNQFRIIPLQQPNNELVTDFVQFTDAQVDVVNQYDREKHNYEEDA